MYLGKLNDKVRFECAKSSGEALAVNGNPLLGEAAVIDWKDLLNESADLKLSFMEDLFVDSLILHLNENCEPKEIQLWDNDANELLKDYCGETGKPIVEKNILFEVGRCCKSLTLRCKADFSSIRLDGLDVYGGILEEKPLYPTPVSQKISEQTIPCDGFKGIKAESDIAASASEILQEKWLEYTGLSLAISDSGNIVLRADPAIAENGYRLRVEADQILIEAADCRGFVQGVETLIKLLNQNKLPLAEVEDHPFMPFRGAHLYIPAMEQIPFYCRLVKYLLSPMGYNHIIMELAGAMEYESHPEINACFEDGVQKASEGIWPQFPHGSVGGGKTVKKQAIRELIAYTRRYGIAIIPEVQSLGHVQFMTLAHPEIAERAEEAVEENVDARFEDIPPSEFYAHCYCPSNEKSYEILFDLLDEVIELFQPKEYVHMGHDEVRPFPLCPACRSKDPAKLYADDVNRIYDHLKSKGLKMMIWSDMVNPVTKGKYQTYTAIDMIPKDIVMMDFIWYFHIPKDIEDGLLEKGYRVLFGNMYSSHFPRYESRIRKNGVFGGEVSTWVQTSEYAIAKEGKMYDFLYTAEMLWTEKYRECLRRSYNHIVTGLIPGLREKLGNIRYPSLHIEGETLYCGRSAEMPALKVNGCYDSLAFTHTTLKNHFHEAWAALEEIGSYTVEYGDGTTEKISLTFDGTIGYAGRRYNEPLKPGYYRHNGYYGTYFTDGVEEKLPDGRLGTLYRYEWINPAPKKKILRITRDGEDIYTASVEGYRG